jgi:branched-chain amino acid transport system substrate-binding protein
MNLMFSAVMSVPSSHARTSSRDAMRAVRPAVGGPHAQAKWLQRTGLALGLLGMSVAGFGCPRGPSAKPLSRLELAASPEPRAEADFREASAFEERGDNDKAQQRYRAFIDAWPKDPLAPYARFALGKLELAAGAPRKALSWFELVVKSSDSTLAERGRIFAGIAHSQLGDHQLAVVELKPYLGRTVDPRETNALLDALATSQAQLGDPLAALDTSDKQLRGELSTADRKRVEARTRKLIDAIEPTLSLNRAYEILARDGLAWPEIARRLLRKSQQGDSQKVAKIAVDLRDQKIDLDDDLAALVLRAERSTDADPAVIGAILPLSGRGREAGEAALQGLMLSADMPSPKGQLPLRLVYRDDAGDPERALAAFEDLVAVHRVIAVIGPMSAGPARAVAARAKQAGLPLLLLSPDGSLTRDASTVFRLLGDASEEATQLVKRATRAGAKRFVVLHPKSPFGDSMRLAFEAAVSSQGGSNVGSVSYDPASTNLVHEAEAAAKLDADAVVLADGAARITLLAPALAAQGLWSVTRGNKPPEGRAVLYLIPSAGFDPTLAQTSRRYLQGALFAVPFDAGQAGTFCAAYREQYQAEPNLFSASAYDAFNLLRSALHGGAQTRGALATALTTVRAQGTVTANNGFSATRGPLKPVQVETLLGEGFVPVD